MISAASAPAAAPRLKRSLTLWDLILYGISVIQPVAPMSVFGVLSDRGRGHVVVTCAPQEVHTHIKRCNFRE
jgi:hypothetical protein